MAWVHNELKQTPETKEEIDDHMRASMLLDGFTAGLHRCSEALLRPYAEGRRDMPQAVAEAWFAPLVERIAELQPDLVGLSILSEQTLLWGVATARFLSEHVDAKVAVGGALISHLNAEEILLACPWIDLVFAGEADQSLPDYLERDGDDLEGTPGLVHRKKDGQVCVHPVDSQIDVNDLPLADFSDTALELDYRALLRKSEPEPGGPPGRRFDRSTWSGLSVVSSPGTSLLQPPVQRELRSQTLPAYPGDDSWARKFSLEVSWPPGPQSFPVSKRPVDC